MSKKTTPIKAIRLKCLDCMCGSAIEVKLCPSEDCTLWGFRMGRNPLRRGIVGKSIETQKKHDSTTDK